VGKAAQAANATPITSKAIFMTLSWCRQVGGLWP
jgi:hypothetical protein